MPIADLLGSPFPPRELFRAEEIWSYPLHSLRSGYRYILDPIKRLQVSHEQAHMREPGLEQGLMTQNELDVLLDIYYREASVPSSTLAQRKIPAESEQINKNDNEPSCTLEEVTKVGIASAPSLLLAKGKSVGPEQPECRPHNMGIDVEHDEHSFDNSPGDLGGTQDSIQHGIGNEMQQQSLDASYDSHTNQLRGPITNDNRRSTDGLYRETDDKASYTTNSAFEGAAKSKSGPEAQWQISHQPKRSQRARMRFSIASRTEGSSSSSAEQWSSVQRKRPANVPTAASTRPRRSQKIM